MRRSIRPKRATPGSELLSKYRTEAPKGRQFQDVELRLNCEDGHCLCAFLFRCGRRLLRRIRHSERGAQGVKDGPGHLLEVRGLFEGCFLHLCRVGEVVTSHVAV